jgi:glutathione gamma-glutamylcysteinyltransferase
MYFPLSEVFGTQSEPAFCGVSSLCMILNCLSIDPTVVHGQRGIWKGPWRWYHEDLLDCCTPLEYIVKNGITMQELDCLAQCNGLSTKPVRVCATDVDSFRDMLIGMCQQPDPVSEYIVVNYNRKVLGQTGTGHFSPIAAYDATTDMALILDVARFKYPPHWVKLETLVEAMTSADLSTLQPRGYITLRRETDTYEAIVFTTIGTAEITPDVWDHLHHWVSGDFVPTSDDLILFIRSFRENYTSVIVKNFVELLKDSQYFNSYPLIKAESEGGRGVFCADDSLDMTNPGCIEILDRLSWTLVMLSAEWCQHLNNIDVENIAGSSATVVHCGSSTLAATASGCCGAAAAGAGCKRKLRPSAGNMTPRMLREIGHPAATAANPPTDDTDTTATSDRQSSSVYSETLLCSSAHDIIVNELATLTTKMLLFTLNQ